MNKAFWLKIFFLLFFSGSIYQGYAQDAIISGKIVDDAQRGIQGVNVITGRGTGTNTDSLGHFVITVPPNVPINLTISHVGYQTIRRIFSLGPSGSLQLNLQMTSESQLMEEIEIREKRQEDDFVPSLTTVEPETARLLPTPFEEFNKILSTLPGVVSNNELSATYSVRGGNYDENLVNINDTPIYRPFLVRAGQQEGLSFVNPSLVENIEFSSGGWAPEYGDKLSSNLNITYKRPTKFAGSASVSLLGGNAHIEGVTANRRFTYLAGVRHKSAQYLFNTLDTKGEYLPRFTDVQGYLTYNLDPDGNRTELSLLLGYANNRYLVEPETRETSFGTFGQPFRFIVGFDGQDLLKYQTYQSALRLNHRFSDRFTTSVIASGFYTQEREFYDVEGAYRLCDIDRNPGSTTFNECAITRGLGSNYRSGRNLLDAKIFNLQSRSELQFGSRNQLKFGFGYDRELIEDRLNEYEFTDSADFVLFPNPPINSSIDLDTYRLQGYIQHNYWIASNQKLTYGVRFNYWSYSAQWLVSPRLQYAYQMLWKRPVTFTAAFGWYQQPPFYRELRNFQGEINPDIKAQSSIHAILGADYNFQMWDRNFKFVSEVYYKHLDQVIPYDVDNVRIRYYGDNIATAYAAGLDLRVSGAFIENTESWFSLGILKTAEDLTIDDQGPVRRPSDQRITLGIYFEDHMPTDPSVRVYLNLLYGSGLPFGPPNNLEYRNQFDGRAYNRVDIGFSKLVNMRAGKSSSKGINTVWLNAEVLNLLGANNTISYTWITDLHNRQFAVPNNLSQRFFNFRIRVDF
ncbi:MAG: TonB-dependent receptor [Cyclobacteriaceae bacterium]|nr:MAG: TonB-dependent receptor [Cyclobacteriaceae bacterium]